MKKLVLILTLAAFACSPLVMTPAQAAPVAHNNLQAKIQKKKAQLKKLKQRQHNHKKGHKHGGKHNK